MFKQKIYYIQHLLYSTFSYLKKKLQKDKKPCRFIAGTNFGSYQFRLPEQFSLPYGRKNYSEPRRRAPISKFKFKTRENLHQNFRFYYLALQRKSELASRRSS